MKYSERRAQIIGEGVTRKVFNAEEFNQIGTAILNDPDYTTTVVVTKNGELEKKEVTPVKELRQKLIGGVLKAAGHDAAEQAKFVETYEFPVLPLHGFISETLTESMEQRPFTFLRKEDMRASIHIKKMDEEIKDVKSPQTGNVSKKKYGAYRKLKAQSVCPANLRSDV